MTKRTDVGTPYYPTYEKSSPGPDPNLKTHLVGSHHIRILNKFNLTNCEQRLTCRGVQRGWGCWGLGGGARRGQLITTEPLLSGLSTILVRVCLWGWGWGAAAPPSGRQPWGAPPVPIGTATPRNVRPHGGAGIECRYSVVNQGLLSSPLHSASTQHSRR